METYESVLGLFNQKNGTKIPVFIHEKQRTMPKAYEDVRAPIFPYYKQQIKMD